MEKAQEKIKGFKERGIPLERRQKQFLHFTDMSTAFDSIQRHTLFRMMRDKGIDGNLVETIREMILIATMSDGTDNTTTSIGSMQGSTLSPLIFAFYINDMLEEL